MENRRQFCSAVLGPRQTREMALNPTTTHTTRGFWRGLRYWGTPREGTFKAGPNSGRWPREMAGADRCTHLLVLDHAPFTTAAVASPTLAAALRPHAASKSQLLNSRLHFVGAGRCRYDRRLRRRSAHRMHYNVFDDVN